jgi:hypothetical protein
MTTCRLRSAALGLSLTLLPLALLAHGMSDADKQRMLTGHGPWLFNQPANHTGP